MFSALAMEAISAGAVATIPHLTIPIALEIRVLPATPVEEAIAEEVVVMEEAAVAINDAPPLAIVSVLCLPYGFLDSFQSRLGISLESLEKTLFPFASCRRLKYRWALATPMGSPFL
jgi:hypothetical protein